MATLPKPRPDFLSPNRPHKLSVGSQLKRRRLLGVVALIVVAARRVRVENIAVRAGFPHIDICGLVHRTPLIDLGREAHGLDTGPQLLVAVLPGSVARYDTAPGYKRTRLGHGNFFAHR